jgi:hypothetical protein
MPPSHTPILAVETKDFIPSGTVDWFNNPIPAPDAFEEGNLANISPTIKIDISVKPGVVEEIIIGAACTPERNQHPAAYIMAVPRPLFIPSPRGALFSYHGQVRTRIVTFI